MTITNRPAGEIPTTNAARIPHPDLKQMIDAAQPADAYSLGSDWVALGEQMQTFAESMRGIANSTQARWEGAAGDAARGALLSLADWSSATGGGIQTMSSNVDGQSSAASIAQSSMPDPVPYAAAEYQARLNSTSSPAEWVQIIADAYDQYNAHIEAERDAQQVATVYSQSLRETATTMPAFAPPPTFGEGYTTSLPPVGSQPGISGSGGTVPATSGGGDPYSPVAPAPAPTGPSIAPTFPQQQGPSQVLYPPGTQPPGPGQYPPGTYPPGTYPPGYYPPGTYPPSTSRPPAATAPGRPGPGAPGRTGRLGPGGFGPGRGGFGPRGSGFGPGSAAGGGRGLGAGGFGAAAGMADDAAAAGRGTAGRGGAGAGGFGPVAGAGAGRDDDRERRRPAYLVEADDVWGDGTLVAPPVIGEALPEHYRRGGS